ncbi:MAG: copper uptake system-associated protein [Steroidobacteraceae bacterium]
MKQICIAATPVAARPLSPAAGRWLALVWLCSLCGAVLAAPGDVQAIADAMHAEFDAPSLPLLVNPVNVLDGFALAGWSQAHTGGRALLRQQHAAWQVVLCGGDALLQPQVLTAAGMAPAAATRLLALVRGAEAQLPAAGRARFSSFAGLVAVAHAAPAPEPQPAGVAAGSISLAAAWTRATLPGSSMAAVYLTIANRGKAADELVSATSPVATGVELHRSSIDNGMARMRAAGAVAIAAGQTVNIEPGGLHYMLTGLAQPLVAGARVPLTLQFRNAGALTVQVQVVAVTATGPDTAAPHHHGGNP